MFERNSYSFERTLSILQGLSLQLHPLAVERRINHFVNPNKDSKNPGVETDSLTAEYFCRPRLSHLSFFCTMQILCTSARQHLHLDHVNIVTYANVCYYSHCSAGKVSMHAQ